MSDLSEVLSAKVVNEGYPLCEAILKELEVTIKLRQQTIETLSTLADTIDKHHHNARIAKIAGVSTGIVGTGAGIVLTGTIIALGIAAAPVTLGASIALTVVGGAAAGASVAGTATTVGAGIADWGITKIQKEKAQKAMDKDVAQCERFAECCKKVERLVQDLSSKYRFVSPIRIQSLLWKGFIKFGPRSPQYLANGANMSIKAAKWTTQMVRYSSGLRAGAKMLRGLAFASKIAGSVGAVFNAVFLIFDIVNLTVLAVEAHNKTCSDAAKEIRTAVSDLKEELRSMENELSALRLDDPFVSESESDDDSDSY